MFSFAGAGSTSAAAVDATAGNLKINLAVTAGQYAGGGMQFDSCVRATAFNSVQFTAAITAGSLSGCTWQVRSRPRISEPQRAPTRAAAPVFPAATCYRSRPLQSLPFDSRDDITTRLTAFSNPAGSAIPTPTQIVGCSGKRTLPLGRAPATSSCGSTTSGSSRNDRHTLRAGSGESSSRPASDATSLSARIVRDLQHDLARRAAALLGREGRAALGERHDRTDDRA